MIYKIVVLYSFIAVAMYYLMKETRLIGMIFLGW